MADTAPTEVKQISHNELRTILEQGFAELMAVMLEGDESTIRLGCDYRGKFIPFVEELEPLPTLRDFATTVATLQRGKRGADKIRKILAEGGAQAIISEDDNWHQTFNG